jgi:hypothetical protein
MQKASAMEAAVIWEGATRTGRVCQKPSRIRRFSKTLEIEFFFQNTVEEWI